MSDARLQGRDRPRLLDVRSTWHAEIPVLGPVELGAFKAIYARARDWADIEAMIAAETLDLEAVRAELGRMLRSEDPRLERLGEAVRQADGDR